MLCMSAFTAVLLFMSWVAIEIFRRWWFMRWAKRNAEKWSKHEND